MSQRSNEHDPLICYINYFDFFSFFFLLMCFNSNWGAVCWGWSSSCYLDHAGMGTKVWNHPYPWLPLFVNSCFIKYAILSLFIYLFWHLKIIPFLICLMWVLLNGSSICNKPNVSCTITCNIGFCFSVSLFFVFFLFSSKNKKKNPNLHIYGTWYVSDVKLLHIFVTV